MPKPKRRSSSRSFLPYSGPRVPTWRERLGVDDALLDGAAERGAVGVLGAEVGVPGVQVRVEVHQRDRAVLAAAAARSRGSAMVWSPPMVTSLVPSRGELAGGGLDGLDRLVDVERVHRDVAGVGHLGDLERRHVQRRVVGPQQPRRLADVGGAEPGARPVGDTGVERHSDDGDVGALATWSRRGSRANVAGRRSAAPWTRRRVRWVCSCGHFLCGRADFGRVHRR